MKIDFSSVEDLKPVPPDQYPATLTEFKIVPEAKSSGKPYVSLTFTLSEGDYEGRKMWRNYSLQPQSLWAFKTTAVRLGADPDVFEGEVDIEEVCESLIGNECIVDVGIREYQGEDRNDVRNVLEAGAAYSSFSRGGV